MKNTALLTIDMQNDVLRRIVPTGAAVIPAIRRVLEACRAGNMPIVHCLRVHRPGGVDVEKFRLEQFRADPFLVRDTEGADLIPELEARDGEYRIFKSRFSSFFQTDLQMILSRLAISTVAVCGVQTPNCVRCTITDAIAYDFDVIALDDAIAAATPEIHRANMDDMRRMGVKVMMADEFSAGLSGS